MPIPSDEDMKRISRTVTYVERLQRSAPVAPSQQQFVAPIVQLVRVTGDPAVSGRYPAIVQDYDAETDTWSDLTDADCYAIDPDGGTLAEGTYLARRWGEYNSLPVFTPTEQIAATPTQWGLVTDTTQSFAGEKTFTNTTIGTIFYAGDTNTLTTAIKNHITDTPAYGHLFYPGASNGLWHSTFAAPETVRAAIWCNVQKGADLSWGGGWTIESSPDGTVPAKFTVWQKSGVTGYPVFAVGNETSGQTLGISGTDGVGNVFVGGINTSLGSSGGSVPSNTQDGTILMGVSAAWLEKFAITNSEGYIVTNEEGLIVASGV